MYEVDDVVAGESSHDIEIGTAPSLLKIAANPLLPLLKTVVPLAIV